MLPQVSVHWRWVMLDWGLRRGQIETNTKESIGEDWHGEGQGNECL